MTNFPRLLDASPDAATLLSSGLEDGPHPSALPKVATQLGVSAAALASAAAASAATGAAGATATGAAGATTVASGLGATGTVATGGALLALGKTLLVSMLATGALSVGAIAVHEQLSSSPGESAPARPPAVARQTPGQSAALGRATLQGRATSQGQVSEASDATSASVPHEAAPESLRATAETQASPSGNVGVVERSAPSPRFASPAVTAPGALAREVERIDRAKRALDSSDPRTALAELEHYERSHTQGVLEREALLLRVEALVQEGRHAEAKSLARDYLKRFPNDAHAPRMRALLGQAQTSVGALPSQ